MVPSSALAMLVSMVMAFLARTSMSVLRPLLALARCIPRARTPLVHSLAPAMLDMRARRSISPEVFLGSVWKLPLSEMLDLIGSE